MKLMKRKSLLSDYKIHLTGLEILIILLTIISLVSPNTVLNSNANFRSGGRFYRAASSNNSNVKAMVYTLRGFMKDCDGQCFYHPVGCDNTIMDCKVAVSIVQQKPHCSKEIHSRDTVDSILCKAQNDVNIQAQFFKVALMRVVKNYVCKPEGKTLRRCVPEEFIAVSLTDGTNATLNDDDVWYVCRAGEAAITTWTRVTEYHKALKIKESQPFYSGGAGALWSRIIYRDEDKTLICQFVLSTQYMSIKNVSTPTVSLTNLNSLKFKYSQGRFQINASKGIAPMFSSDTPGVDESEFVAFNEVLDFDKMAIRIEEDNSTKIKSNEDDILNTYNLCKYKNYVACFTPNNKYGCRKKKNCPIIAIIRRISTDTLKFHLIIQEGKKSSFAVRAINPYGWGSVGFIEGHDSSGEALTMSCTVKGLEAAAFIGFKNEAKQNFEANENSTSKMEDKEFSITGKDGKYKYMCIWTLKADGSLERTARQQLGKKDEIGDVKVRKDYDFENNYRVMLASGNTLQKGGHLSMHSYREILFEKFKIDDIKVKVILSASDKGFSVTNDRLHLALCFITVAPSLYFRWSL